MRPRLRVPTALLTLALLATPVLFASPAAARDPVRVVVAVLPFRVHSAAPLEYLEESLASLLTSRLEASGQVEVVESVVVREAVVGYAAAELTETNLRDLARDLSADYVVAGSLTELAGHYSLDVRVTPVGSDVPSHSMVLTAEGDEELLDRVNELSDRVLEIVAGEPARAEVKEVRVVGGGELEAQARARLRTQAGRDYDGGVARQDLTDLRALPGVASATVETERTPEGMVVTFRLVTAERLMGEPGAPQGAEPVAEVLVRGNRRIEANAIRARISTRPGDPYNPSQVARDVREVHALGFFRDVRVLSQETLDGRVLVFEVEENPVVRQVAVSGNESIDSERIRDALTLTTGSTLDYPLLFENRERVEALYRAEGYYLAKVSYEIDEISADAVGVNFVVEEGKKLRLREIRFEGNEHFSESELRAGMTTRPWRFWSYVTRFIDRSGTYSEPVFLQDLQGVETKYTDAGFVRVEVSDPEVAPTGDGLTVTVRIREGERYKVGAVDVTGDETVDLASLRETLKLTEGEWFSRSHLTTDVEGLTQYYTSRGFYYASVTPQTEIAEESRTVDVTFGVTKGDLYFVRQIDIAGNTTTIDPVIRREMQVVEGELYSARASQLSEKRVRDLGFFEEVTFEARQTDHPEQLDLDVKVIEKPTGSLSFGAGFSSQDGFVVSGSLAQANLFGRGYGVQLSADVGSETDRFYASFSDPYFLGSTFGFASTIFRTEIEYEDFFQQESGIEFTLGHALDEENRARGFTRYSYGTREVTEQTGVNAASMIFRELLQGEESISMASAGFRRDTTDDRVAPTAGSLTGGSVEFAGLGGFASFLRFEGRATHFRRLPGWWPGWWPLREKSTLVFAARAGWALPFNTIEDYDLPEAFDPGSPSENRPLTGIDTDLDLPLTERYFLGGLGTFQLRGYEARSVGPRRAVLQRSGLFGTGPLFRPVGTEFVFDATTGLPDAVCNDDPNVFGNQGDGDQECNSLYDKEVGDFDDLDETDVIGGNKFLSLSSEYRFPISESLGLVGILFLDAGNAFAEDESLFDVGLWRYGTGFGAQWFSPFGPLQGFVGFPLNALETEDNMVFEFSVGGATF